MANKFRGEAEVVINGKKCIARPTFDAVANIEDMTGRGAYALMASFASPSSIRVKDMAAVLYCCVQAGSPGTTVTYAEVGAECLEGGISKHLESIVGLLSSALATDEDIKEAAGQVEGNRPAATE